MFVFHTHKDNALSLETVGFYGIDPEASLEEFFRLKPPKRNLSTMGCPINARGCKRFYHGNEDFVTKGSLVALRKIDTV